MTCRKGLAFQRRIILPVPQVAESDAHIVLDHRQFCGARSPVYSAKRGLVGAHGLVKHFGVVVGVSGQID